MEFEFINETFVPVGQSDEPLTVCYLFSMLRMYRPLLILKDPDPALCCRNSYTTSLYFPPWGFTEQT